MPRRNRRRPANQPADYSKLLRELQDEWARAHGRKTPTQRAYEKRHAAQRAALREANPDRPIDIRDARELLAAYL